MNGIFVRSNKPGQYLAQVESRQYRIDLPDRDDYDRTVSVYALIGKAWKLQGLVNSWNEAMALINSIDQLSTRKVG